MTSFANFIGTLRPDGTQFEAFVKWFLKNDPEWSTQVDQIWLWDEYPDRWGRDCGVDLIFKHKNGETWAVQAKCYSAEYSVTKHDIDKFLSESNRPGIDKRLLIATTDRISGNAKQVCEAQDKQVVRYMLWDFEQSEIEYPDSLSDLSTARRKDPPKPRDYQHVAINDVVAGFKNADRGQLIMACGTGKTFTTLWVKEQLSAQVTLVLLPSLSLLSQTLREWTFGAASSFDVLCVCSDQTVGKRSADEAISSVSDVAFPVTSDIAEIGGFLRRDGEKVLFCTYQSSPLIAEVQSNQSIPAFDLAIADEAHRCAGKTDGLFSTVLDQNLIRTKKRLFTTATPRTFSTAVKTSAEGRGVEVIGMDDEAVFGKVFHSLSFGEAISRSPALLTDYRVVIIGVDDTMIAEWIASRELLETASGLTMDAESLAAQIGLIKAIRDYDIKRMISFHSRVNRAKEFSQGIRYVIQELSEEHRSNDSIWTDFVSGEMPTGTRRKKLDRLKTLDSGIRGVLSNAKCLSEGVDVPALDGVAFIDPRSSQVDIIQAVGRAIRLSEDKEAGTIVLPVFIQDSGDAESSIEASRFKPVWDVLNALKAHDDVLSEQLDKIRTGLGRHVGSFPDEHDLSKIVIDLPKSVDQSFAQSLRIILVERTTESWSFWFGLLASFVESEGHAMVTSTFKTKDGFALGSWVSMQRLKRGQLTSERRQRLESLSGWAWEVLEEKWEEGFAELWRFVEREGHARVSTGYKTEEGFALGSWVKTQRINKDKLSSERAQRLESLNDWVWDVLEENWREGFAALQQFAEREGHASVGTKFKTKDGFALGAWVNTQKINRDKLSSERTQRLESLNGWVWKVREEKWEEGFAALQQFVEREGHTRVPAVFKAKDGFALGNWVVIQRVNRDKLSSVRRQRLESLNGWVWKVREEKWEEGFAALQQFVEREGHARVSTGYKTEEGFALGSWVFAQRARIKKDKLTSERRRRLESLNGWAWEVLEEKWEEGFAALWRFVEREGHASVASAFKTVDGFALGAWVGSQRRKKERLSPERTQRLESLTGWVWDVREEKWEGGFAALRRFVEREGHAKVRQEYQSEDGFALGQWVSNQRLMRDRLSSERRQRLESLNGWVWKAKL